MKKLGLISVISLLLAACGGSDSDSGTKFEDVEQNVALSANGGSIDSASYDETGAALVIDGDTSTQYWAGNVDGDSFVIDFGQTVGLTELKVFTNITGFSSSNPPTVVELSTDKSSWETTAVPNFGGSSDISCSTYSSGSGSITCGYNSEVNARYLRVTTNNSASDSSDVNIYEVEATATVSVPVE